MLAPRHGAALSRVRASGSPDGRNPCERLRRPSVRLTLCERALRRSKEAPGASPREELSMRNKPNRGLSGPPARQALALGRWGETS
jgi:hypothetical protein